MHREQASCHPPQVVAGSGNLGSRLGCWQNDGHRDSATDCGLDSLSHSHDLLSILAENGWDAKDA